MASGKRQAASGKRQAASGKRQACQDRSVHFHAEHQLSGSVAAVVELLSDPDFYLGLDLPDLSRPDVVQDEVHGDRTTLRLRYQFVGTIDPIAQRLIGADRLSWIQEVRVDRSAGSGTLGFEAEKNPGRLHGTAEFSLTRSGDHTQRQIDGDLVVAVPGIGRMAERRIVPGILHRLDIEAHALDEQLHHRS